MAESNYTRLFGTPERAAHTFNSRETPCKFCLFFDYCGDGCLIDDGNLLEWLEGEAG